MTRRLHRAYLSARGASLLPTVVYVALGIDSSSPRPGESYGSFFCVRQIFTGCLVVLMPQSSQIALLLGKGSG